MMREPKTDPIPAPDPATPTVAAPAPMNLAAESMSFFFVVVVRARLPMMAWKINKLKSDLCPSKIYHKGSSIKDVSSEGEGGGSLQKRFST